MRAVVPCVARSCMAHFSRRNCPLRLRFIIMLTNVHNENIHGSYLGGS